MATIPSGQKILTSAPEVNTNYGGPASLQVLNTWYTMEDISNTVKPYKVYTALLTQSGGDNAVGLNSGSLIIGVTYFINDTQVGMDFTNVGAPNNNVGTYFVATGTTPNSWGIDIGAGVLIYNTGAPVVTVLENTIGNIYWIYDSAGEYSGILDGAFTSDKTYCNITMTSGGGLDIGQFVQLSNQSDKVQIATWSNGTAEDQLLSKTPIEIRVYN